MRKHPTCILSLAVLAAALSPGSTFGQYYYPQQVAQNQQTPVLQQQLQQQQFQQQQIRQQQMLPQQQTQQAPIQSPPLVASNCGSCNTQPTGSYYSPGTAAGPQYYAPSTATSSHPSVPNAAGIASGTPDAMPGNAIAPHASMQGASYGDVGYSTYGTSCSAGNGAGYNAGRGTGYCASPSYRNRPLGLWYASAAGLYLGRNEPNRVWTSYENNNNANQLMHTQDVTPDWEGGVDLRLGRYFACGRWRMELGFWSVNNFSAYSSQTHANGVSSPLQFNDLEFSVGDPVADYFDSAMEHRLTRTNELYNVELNIIEGNIPNAGCSPWSSRMLVGLRYFQFNEDLVFATLDQGGTWGGNGGLDEVYMSDSTRNDLFGAQIGCLFQRSIGSRTQLFITPKFGVYNNHIQNRFDLRRGDGTAAMPSAFSNVSGGYPVESSTNTVAFLSEADLGLQYQISHRWTVFGGYRVLAINNIGLADNQIPQYIVDIPEIADIDTNGSLILHGAFFGVSRLF